MPRYRLTIEYDGSPYVGWQRQSNGPSVQAAIEVAILAVSSEQATVFGSGRTDTGVHAEGQVGQSTPHASGTASACAPLSRRI